MKTKLKIAAFLASIPLVACLEQISISNAFYAISYPNDVVVLAGVIGLCLIILFNILIGWFYISTTKNFFNHLNNQKQK